MKEKEILAIIPARGGSKRIPRKNIKNFLGDPILKYSISAALSSNCFSEIMVSTDDEEIANVARGYGATIPFFRSSITANDYATTYDVIEEVIAKYKEVGRNFDAFCCIYPTAIFVTSESLLKSYELFFKANADFIIPVVQFSYPIQRALIINNNKLQMIWPENTIKRTQDLQPTFHDAGQFYWGRINSFLANKSFYSENTLPFILSESEVQDIDTEEDWKIAEMKYRILKSISM